MTAPNTNRGKGLLHGIGWSVCQNLSAQILSTVVFVVLARLLAPGDFGVVAYASVLIAFVQIFVEQGMPDAVVQKKDLDAEHLDAAFWFNLAVGIFLFIAIWICSPFLAACLHEPRLVRVLPGLALGIPLFGLTSVQQAWLRRNLDYKPLAIRTAMSAGVGGLVGIAMALMRCGVWSLVGQQIAGALAGVAILWSVSTWRPRFRFSASHLKDLRGFAGHVTVSAFLDFFNRRADDFLIGYCLGATALGCYSVAYRILLTLTRLITAPLNSVALPVFSRAQADRESLRAVFHQFTQSAALAAFPAFLGLLVVAPEFISVCFGKQWAASVPVLRILCLIGILHSVALFHGTLVRAVGRADWQMWFTLGGAVTNVIGFYIAVHFGISAVALAYVISAYLWLTVDLALVRKALQAPIRLYLRRMVIPALAALTMAGVVGFARTLYLSYLAAPVALAADLFLAAAAYSVALLVLMPEAPAFLRANFARITRRESPVPVS